MDSRTFHAFHVGSLVNRLKERGDYGAQLHRISGMMDSHLL